MCNGSYRKGSIFCEFLPTCTRSKQWHPSCICTAGAPLRSSVPHPLESDEENSRQLHRSFPKRLANRMGLQHLDLPCLLNVVCSALPARVPVPVTAGNEVRSRSSFASGSGPWPWLVPLMRTRRVQANAVVDTDANAMGFPPEKRYYRWWWVDVLVFLMGFCHIKVLREWRKLPPLDQGKMGRERCSALRESHTPCLSFRSAFGRVIILSVRMTAPQKTCE